MEAGGKRLWGASFCRRDSPAVFFNNLVLHEMVRANVDISGSDSMFLFVM